MTAVALALLALAAGGTEALDVTIAPYRQAAQTGRVGIVAGRVYAESATPTGPPRRLPGVVSVLLLPRSETLVAAFEHFKEDARASSKAFAAAAPAMRQTQDTYERELLRAGSPDLALRVGVDAGGSFRIPDVPVGAWLVIVWQSTPNEVSAPKDGGRDRKLYQGNERVTGFQSVTIWLREVTVVYGETTALELTDRNGWFRGVIEDKRRDTGR
jgi:hypothetical protein